MRAHFPNHVRQPVINNPNSSYTVLPRHLVGSSCQLVSSISKVPDFEGSGLAGLTLGLSIKE